MSRQAAHRERIEKIRRYWRKRVEDHLCGRKRPTRSAWTAMFMKLVEHVKLAQDELGRIGEEVEEVGFDPREPLVWVWCVLESMPNDQQQRYQALKEHGADGSGLSARADVVRSRGYVMQDLKTALGAQVAWLGALARALDDDLAALQFWPDDVRQWSAGDWRPPGYACFVVPVQRSYRLGNGRSAQRRAFKYHAVLPERIGDTSIELHLHPRGDGDLAEDPSEWNFGAAVFPTMTVVPEEIGAHGFRLTDAPIPEGEAAAIQAQVWQARDGGTEILVWPELSMPRSRLKMLQAELAKDPMAGSSVRIVVAGSWHVEGEKRKDPDAAIDAATADTSGNGVGGRFVNRSEILFGDGEPMLIYDKRRRFPFNGRIEEIEVGSVLPVIVMEDRLIGVAICRDNCDDGDREGYRELPIDLIIVPSMGGDTTVEAHLRHAKAQRSTQGTCTLVVQQALAVDGQSRPEGAPAFSFIAPEEKGASNKPDREQDELFRNLGGRRAA